MSSDHIVLKNQRGAIHWNDKTLIPISSWLGISHQPFQLPSHPPGASCFPVPGSGTQGSQVSAPHKRHVAITPSAAAEACTWCCFSPTEDESNYREGSWPSIHCDLCHRNTAVIKDLVAKVRE